MAGIGPVEGDGSVGDDGPGWSAVVGSAPAGSSDIAGPGVGSSKSIGIGTGSIGDAGVMAGTAIVTSTGTASMGMSGPAITATVIGSSGDTPLALAAAISAAAATMASGTATLTGAVEAVPSAIATSDNDSFMSIFEVAEGGATAVGVGAGLMSMTSEVVAKSTEDPPFVVTQIPDLMPLQVSWEADSLEREVKQIVIGLIEEYRRDGDNEITMREGERFINALGMPHLGSRELVEQSLAANGIPIYRGASNGASAGAYLLRAWLSRNPKRGLHMLKHMLQMLWPNSATINQMWQEKAEPYPTALLAKDAIPEGDEDDYFLTSRVHVSLPARVTSGGDVAAIQSGLRATLPARMLLNLAIEEEASFGVGIVAVYYKGCVAQSYEGTFT